MHTLFWMVSIFTFTLFMGSDSMAANPCESIQFEGRFQFHYTDSNQLKDVEILTGNTNGTYHVYSINPAIRSHEWTLSVDLDPDRPSVCVVRFGGSDLLGQAPHYEVTEEQGKVLLAEIPDDPYAYGVNAEFIRIRR